MVLPAILIFFLFFASPISANIHLCKLNPYGAGDQEFVQVCNSSNQVQNLSTYAIKDAAQSLKNLNCSLPAGKSYSISYSGLNNTGGEYVILKDGEEIVDCIYYLSPDSPPENCLKTPSPTSNQCLALVNGNWQNTEDCSSSGTQHCITNTTTFTPTPTSSPTPENTPTLAPTQSFVPGSNIIINSWPSSVDLGQSFTITFTLDNIKLQTEYYVKAYEDSDTNKSLEVFVNDSWQSSYKTVSWELMPKFSSDNSPINRDLQLRANPDKNSGDYQIYLKAAPVSATNKSYLSSAKTISINSTNPSDTPIPTETPIPTASVPPTATPSPSTTPTPSPAPVGIDTISDESDSSILGTQDSTHTPFDSESTSLSNGATNLIPKIFIGLGTLFLLVPVFITKIKKC